MSSASFGKFWMNSSATVERVRRRFIVPFNFPVVLC